MQHFAVVSRHTPSTEQQLLAEEQGVTLTHIGDADAFTVTPDVVEAAGLARHIAFDGVVVVHPAAALRLNGDYAIGVFENADRAEVGEKPRFVACTFHVYPKR